MILRTVCLPGISLLKKLFLTADFLYVILNILTVIYPAGYLYVQFRLLYLTIRMFPQHRAFRRTEKKNIRFVFSWYFPNHFTKTGKRLGHYYENLYKNSLDANRFLYDNYDRVYKAAVDFSSLLYNTTLPSVHPDAWSSNLSQLVKSSCYLKNGKFGLWEGLGYCGFHATDVKLDSSSCGFRYFS